jgi:hypothetical protein
MAFLSTGSSTRTEHRPNRPGASHRGTQLAPRREIPRAPGTTLRVLAVRDDDADRVPVLVVEDMSERATSNDAT